MTRRSTPPAIQRPYSVRVCATGQTVTVLASSPWLAFAEAQPALTYPRYADVEVTELPLVPVPPPAAELPPPPWADVRRLLARAAMVARKHPDMRWEQVADLVIAEGLP